MSEKKYIGNGKNSKFGNNIQVNLNQLFENIYNDTQNKAIVKIFTELKKELSNSNLAYMSKWKSGEKDNFAVKISVNNRKEPDKIGNDLTVSLNEFVPEKKTEKSSVNDFQSDEQGNDLPW